MNRKEGTDRDRPFLLVTLLHSDSIADMTPFLCIYAAFLWWLLFLLPPSVLFYYLDGPFLNGDGGWQKERKPSLLVSNTASSLSSHVSRHSLPNQFVMLCCVPTASCRRYSCISM